jgi:hypothetical protein
MSTSHNQYPTIPEISRRDALDIVEELAALPSAEVFDDIFGLETVDRLGEVRLTRATTAKATPDGGGPKTVVSRLPLVSYYDGTVQHDVTLYSRKVSGFHNELGEGVDESLFVVDQGADADGNKFMAATPGRLFRTSKGEARHDNPQLTLALLQGANGGEGLSSF